MEIPIDEINKIGVEWEQWTRIKDLDRIKLKDGRIVFRAYDKVFDNIREAGDYWNKLTFEAIKKCHESHKPDPEGFIKCLIRHLKK